MCNAICALLLIFVASLPAAWGTYTPATVLNTRALNVQHADVAVSSVADGYTFSIPAGTLNTDGDYVEFECYGTLSTATLTHQLQVAGNSMVSQANTAIGADFIILGRLVRTGATTCDAFGSVELDRSVNLPTHTFSTPTVTWANRNTIRVTVTAHTAGSVTYKSWVVKLHRVPT